MLIISYFLGFALIIYTIIVLVPYLRLYLHQRVQHKPLNLNRKSFSDEFSDEFFPNNSVKEGAPVEYDWKGHLSKKAKIGELPATYQDNKLILLIKNPNCLYAYWDTTKDWGPGIPALRIYEAVSCEGDLKFSFLFDIDIPHDAKNWFINVQKDNWSYYAELGQRMPDGSFVLLLKSNLVTTPRSSLSTIIDDNWIPCNVYGKLGNISYGMSSAHLQKESERIDH